MTRRHRRPAAAADEDAPQLTASTVAIAGTVVVIASVTSYSRIGFVGLAIGPAIDLIVMPFVFRAAGRPYRTPGAPLWSVCIAVVAMIPAIGTFRDPAIGLPLTAAAALPAMALGFLSWRRPLGRIGRCGVGIAIAAVAISAIQWLLLGRGAS